MRLVLLALVLAAGSALAQNKPPQQGGGGKPPQPPAKPQPPAPPEKPTTGRLNTTENSIGRVLVGSGWVEARSIVTVRSDDSIVQVGLQPSLPARFPSSQASTPSGIPFPQGETEASFVPASSARDDGELQPTSPSANAPTNPAETDENAPRIALE